MNTYIAQTTVSSPVVVHTLSPSLASCLAALSFAIVFHLVCVMLLKFFWW
jgi:hypothetical protein